MAWRTVLKTVGILALLSGGWPAALAEPGTKAKAQVFTRELKDGTRVTFSWDDREPVPFTTENDGDQIVLHFDEPVALRWGSALKAASPAIARVESEDGGTTVILTLDKPAQARPFENEGPRDLDANKNGIDLTPERAAKKPAKLMAEREAPEEDTSPEPEPAPKPAAQPHRAKRAKPVKTARRHSPETAPHEDASAMAALAPAAGPASPAPVPVPVAMAAPAPVQAAAPAPAPAAPAPVMAATLPAAEANSATLPLPFRDGDNFAAFIWQKHLWIVSEGADVPVADALRKAGAPLVSDVQSLPDPHASILNLTLKGDVSATVEKTGDLIQIVLKPGDAKPAQPLAPAMSTTGGQSSLSIPAGKTGDVVHFQDPATGTTLNVVPVGGTGVGVAEPRSFVDLHLLPTAQGIAVQVLSDKVTLSAAGGTVLITAAGGLATSDGTAQANPASDADALIAHKAATLFPYAQWKLDDEKNFVPAQIKLFNDVAAGPADVSNKARLKLLDLYLAEGLYPEAVGMADDILRSSLKFYIANKVSALRGAAYLMMYRVADAARDFAAPELKGDPEAALWLALCNELLGDENARFDFSGQYDRYVSHYPPPMIDKLAIIAADRSINRKDYDAANGIFDLLKRDNYDEPVKKYIDYMRAKILSETHDEAEAEKIWEGQARELDDPLIRARAEFSLINMLVKSDKIGHEEAEKRLDKLRIVWRGDSLELSVLTLLGNLYYQDKQYDKALRAMRDIVMYYPEVPEALTTAQDMERIFVLLYNQGGADAMPPLEALSLFFEFRDLVPLGKEGDMMIRNLADRLVKIDLLDRAALLLDHQIRNRLQGEDRSRIGAHLAKIYLLNHQPDEALDILKTTGYGNLPADLQLQRQRLTAQALAQQGQSAKAIDVISDDNTPDGEMLKLSIYWDGKDWPNVTTTAEDILGNRNDPSAPLDLPESEVLLKLATAYVYQRDTGQIQYLRDYFTPLMKNNPNRDSFLFITTESGNVDYDNLGSLDQDIGAVKSYLARTEEKPGKNGMSKQAN